MPSNDGKRISMAKTSSPNKPGNVGHETSAYIWMGLIILITFITYHTGITQWVCLGRFSGRSR